MTEKVSSRKPDRKKRFFFQPKADNLPRFCQKKGTDWKKTKKMIADSQAFFSFRPCMRFHVHVAVVSETVNSN